MIKVDGVNNSSEAHVGSMATFQGSNSANAILPQDDEKQEDSADEDGGKTHKVDGAATGHF